MNVSPPWRKPQQSQKTLYCIYCNEELGADPTRCVYCGASLSNPLMATSTVRHDVPDPVIRFAPRPISNRRKAFALILGLAAPSFGPHFVGFRIATLPLTGACVCALLIALAAAWARRKNRIEWPVFFSVAEKLIYASVAFDMGIKLAQPRISEVTTCYGACTARVDGVSAFALAAAGLAVLAVAAVVAVLLITRARSGARLAEARGQARVSGAGRGSLPGNEPWGVTRREREVQATRR